MFAKLPGSLSATGAGCKIVLLDKLESANFVPSSRIAALPFLLYRLQLEVALACGWPTFKISLSGVHAPVVHIANRTQELEACLGGHREHFSKLHELEKLSSYPINSCAQPS